MASFRALTAEVLATLPAGHPVYFRGPDGQMSAEHTILDGASRRISRTVTLKAADGASWGFDPAAVKVEDTVTSRTGSKYTVTSRGGEGDSLKLVAFFVGEIPMDKLPMFSTDPGCQSSTRWFKNDLRLRCYSYNAMDQSDAI